MAYSDDQRPGRRPARDSGSGRSERGDARPARGEGRPARGEGRPERSEGRAERRPERGEQRNDGPSFRSRAGESRSERPARGDSRPPRNDARPARGNDEAPKHQEWANTRRDVEVERKLKPLIPDEITEKDLEIGVRAQLKTLTPENAEKVARHLAMVGLLIDQDPELAHEHALAAADRAGRIAIVRETVGCTAYAIGDFALALRELLTHRRISGSNEQVALIVDSERGLGRPERGIELGRSVDAKELSAEARVNLAIAMSGARLDQGQKELALSELEIAELNPKKVFDYSPPLFFAYADVLEDLGRSADAKRWADLGDRAIAALSGGEDEDETITVLEEIEIPVRREWSPEEREERAKARERYASGDRGGRGSADRSFGDRGSRGDRPERGRGFGSRDERGGREERSDRGARPARADRPERSGRPERSARPESSDRPARPARSDRPARPVSRDDYRPKRDK